MRGTANTTKVTFCQIFSELLFVAYMVTIISPEFRQLNE